MSSETEKCYLIETGYKFTVNGKEEFHRGDYISYWKLPVFIESRNGYDTFNSAYRYSDPDPDKSLLYGGLYLDLDDESNFENVRADALTVFSYFRIVYKIDPSETEIYFSGKKGVHIIIPPEVIGVVPENDLNIIFKYMAGSINAYTEHKTIDMKIYDNKRLFRIPNTIHSGTGLYKIRLSFEELRDYPIDKIKKLALKERKVKHTKHQKNIFAERQYHRMVTEARQQMKDASKDRRYKANINFIPPCIQYILDNGAETGQRNMTIACLASFYKQYGKSIMEATDIITEWNSKNTEPIGEVELKRTIRSLYATEKTYGCSTLKLLSECAPKECRFEINKENKNADTSKNKETKGERDNTDQGQPPSRRRRPVCVP